MSAKPVLGYWDIRGLAQPIKLLLAYTGTEYQDKRFPCGPGPEFDRSQWFDNKFSFGLDFPNLPYYIDGDVKLSQSNAILRYIARKHDMLGKTDKEKAMHGGHNGRGDNGLEECLDRTLLQSRF